VRKQVWPSRVTVSGAPLPTELSLGRGRALFGHYCGGCHGENGNGAGLAADFLRPSASDLTTRYLPREEVFRILFMGSEGSAMPSFAELTEKDLWAISQYVHELGKHNRKPALDYAAGVDRRERGHGLYVKHCQNCHGESGIVPPAMENLKPAPKHFRDRLYDPTYLVQVIRKGRPGTAMAGYSNLSDRDVEDLAAYVSSLFDPKLYKEE
jgi:mono/diheme cytochrome c family protein